MHIHFFQLLIVVILFRLFQSFFGHEKSGRNYANESPSGSFHGTIVVHHRSWWSTGKKHNFHSYSKCFQLKNLNFPRFF